MSKTRKIRRARRARDAALNRLHNLELCHDARVDKLRSMRLQISQLRQDLHAAKDREFRATRAMQNTQAVMTPHLTGKTRVASVYNHRIQLDIPSDSNVDPYQILAGFAHMLTDSDLPLSRDEWPASLPELTSKVPPLVTPISPALKEKRLLGDEVYPNGWSGGRINPASVVSRKKLDND